LPIVLIANVLGWDTQIFLPWNAISQPEKHTKRLAIQQGCIPSLLDDGDTGTEIVYGEDKNILYWADF
jgi:hypothetical protein